MSNSIKTIQVMRGDKVVVINESDFNPDIEKLLESAQEEKPLEVKAKKGKAAK